MTDNEMLYKKYAPERGIIVLLMKDNASVDDVIYTVRKYSRDFGGTVFAGGKLTNIDEVKHMIYAGCERAIFDITQPDTLKELPEAYAKFGVARLCVYVPEGYAVRDSLFRASEHVSLFLTDSEESAELINDITGVDCEILTDVPEENEKAADVADEILRNNQKYISDAVNSVISSGGAADMRSVVEDDSFDDYMEESENPEEEDYDEFSDEPFDGFIEDMDMPEIKGEASEVNDETGAGTEVPVGNDVTQIQTETPEGNHVSEMQAGVPDADNVSGIQGEVPEGNDVSKMQTEVPEGNDVSKMQTEVPEGNDVSQMQTEVPERNDVSQMQTEVPEGNDVSEMQALERGDISGMQVSEDMHEITLIPEDDPGFRVEPIAEIKTWVPKPVADSNITWADLIKNDAGLIPVIVRDYENDDLLMMAWMDEDAYEKTLETGYMTYHSRSRNALWVKGETSGHYQKLVSLTADCDLDTLSAQVYQTGAACHTGNRSCFFNVIRKAPGADDKETDEKPKDTVSEVDTGETGQIFKEALESINTSNTFAGDVLLRDLMVINDRKQNPAEGSYTNYLFDKGIDKILKKVGEEASEIIISAKNGDNDETVYEIGDFLYHLMVLMANEGITWEDVFRELENRENDRQSS